MTDRLYKYSILFCLLFFIQLHSQVIQSVSVMGNKVFTSQELLNALSKFKTQKIYAAITDSAGASVKKLLSSGGYFHSKINAELVNLSGQNFELRITLSEGIPTYINSIKVTGLKGNDSLIAESRFVFLKENLFSQFELEKTIDELLSRYENEGYPFAAVKIASVNFNADSINSRADIRLTIDKKNLCTIDKVEIEGNTKTSSRFITQSSRIELKSIYSQKRIDEIPKQLNRLRFFEPVETPLFFMKNGEGVLRIKIKEKETNSFDGIIGYVPAATDNSSGYFTGFVNIGLRNLFGSGRSAMFRWQTETRETQELELKYSEPWLFNLPLNIDLSLFQRKQDTTYVQRNLEARLEYLATENLSAGVLISTQSTIPSENLISASIFNSTSFITGLTLKYDSRNDFYSPTSGVFFSNVYKFARKNITAKKQFTAVPEGSFNIQKFEVDLAFYLSLFQQQVTALTLHARELKGENYDEADYYRLGGTNSMRGYREKQFSGNRILWSNLEYRFLFSNRSYGFVFLDNGYFLKNGDAARNIEELSQFLTGYGFGLNLETGLGVLTVSFALANGDSFKEGKIHFGIMNEF